MAIKDLAIYPRSKALRYAADKFAVLRVHFEDIEKAANDPRAVRRLARVGRGLTISGKATMDDAVEDEIARAVERSIEALNSQGGL